MALAKITRILMKEGRNYRLRQVVADILIGQPCQIPMEISLNALSEGGITVLPLPQPRKHSGEEKRRPVDRIVSGDLELLFGRDRRVGLVAFGCPVIRQHAESVLVLNEIRLRNVNRLDGGIRSRRRAFRYRV